MPHFEPTELAQIDVNEGSSETVGHDQTTKFVELLTAHQRSLYNYINTLLVGDSAAADVLQDTNLDLWAQMKEFDFDRPFLPWAYGFAYFRVLAFRKSRIRSHVIFNDEIIQIISDTYCQKVSKPDAGLSALRVCIDKLRISERELIRERYLTKSSVTALAARLGATVNQTSARLYRIRKTLAKCIESTLVREL